MNANFAQARIFSDLNALSDVKLAAKNNSPEALKEVATQFEALFLQTMLKTMREASQTEGLFDSNQMQFYEEMHDKQLALHLAERKSLGIADMLIRQLGNSESAKDDGELNDLPAVNPFIPAFVGSQNKLNKTNPNQEYHITETNKAARKVKVNFPDPQSFIRELKPLAEKYASELGVDADLLLAQAALETGWGKKIIQSNQGDSSYNLFGIKADKRWSGDEARVSTLEYRDHKMQKEMASFRSYDSFEQSFQDYVAFIKNNARYEEALSQADKPSDYINALQSAGYATDPKYAEKIIHIMQQDYFTRG